MTIHKKILLLLLISVSLYTVLGAAFQHYLILPSFLALEVEESQKNMQRCLDALDRELYHLDLFCFDWSAWDDTYDFLETHSADYERSNLSSASFVDNGLNLMYFFDREGHIVWGRYYDLETEAPAPFPDFPERGLAATHQLLNPGLRDESIRGIYQSSQGPMLLVSRPILPSEAQENETVRGTMIMGKTLGDDILESIRTQVQVELDVLWVKDAGIPPEFETLEPGEIRVLHDTAKTLRVIAAVDDLEGKPALAFVMYLPREILARGQAAIHLQTMAAIAAGLLFTLLLSFFMQGLITRPLRQLGEQARAVGGRTTVQPSPALRRDDEIGQLAKDFNHMLRRLHDQELERDAINAELRNSQARLETILKTAPDAIVVTNGRGCVESANDAAATLFGYTTAELVGMRGRDLLDESEQAFWIKAVADFSRVPSETPYTADRESAIRDRNGTIHPVHMRVSSVILNGAPYFISSVRDVSGVKAMQATVERARHLATIGEMGATVAHEIRNPLTGMRGAIHLLREGQLTAPNRLEALEGLSESVDRIANIVDQLLRYAKPLTPRPMAFALYPLLEAVTETVTTEGAEGQSFTIGCPSDLMVFADPNLLRQVLENLWANGCHAAGPSGELNWSAENRDGETVIALTDSGPGIDEAIRGRLFEPFFTTRLDGTGLGLSISLRIVEAHRGSIRLEEHTPTGTRVTVRLPEGDV